MRMKRKMPPSLTALMAVSRLPSLVMRMRTTSGRSRRRRPRNSEPRVPGMISSATTTSKVCSARSSSASAAELAVCTSKGSRESSRHIEAVICASSSTKRILAWVGVAPGSVSVVILMRASHRLATAREGMT